MCEYLEIMNSIYKSPIKILCYDYDYVILNLFFSLRTIKNSLIELHLLQIKIWGIWKEKVKQFWDHHYTESLFSSAVFVSWKPFFPLGGKRTNVYWKELHFTWFFYILMATQNNSRNDWLNKNGHDYLLSHRTETGWDSIKNVFEVTVNCENASTINRSVREIKKK